MNEEKNLYNLVYNSQQKDRKSLEILCHQFEPLIKKYSYYLNYEDAYQDLIEAFLVMVQKIPLEKKRFEKKEYILSYIKISIKNTFIYLNKKNQKYIKYTFSLDDNIRDNMIDFASNDKTNVFLVDIQNILGANEFELFCLKFIKGYSDSEIGNMLGITRQGVNKKFQKINKKIKDSYY